MPTHELGLGWGLSDLSEAFAAYIEWRMGVLTSQGLANAAWAFVAMDHKDEWLFTTLAAAAERRMSDFNLQDLANTA